MNVKRLLVMTIVLLAIFSVPAIAQNKTVTGKVTDSKDGSPLANATVTVKGTQLATQTAADGSFKINNVPTSAKTLVISFVGYTPQSMAIGSGNIVASMKAADIIGDAVVVIGYGSTRKKDLTGAISVVSEKDFQKGAITTPEQMIAGKVAGVSVISNGGSPGSGSTIRIRGGSSLNASNDPLIVIDGVPLAPATVPGTTNSSIAGVANPLSMINSDDIESFTVLKDASATAIYGSRAANGVIIITTKKGKAGSLKIDFSTVNSLSTIAKEINVLSAAQFRSVVEENGSAAQIAMMGNANTNWQDQIFQKAFGTTNDISISGGVKKFPYRISLGYQDQDGILKTDKLEKTSIGIALDPVLLNNHLKIDLNLKGSFENTRFANTGAIGAALSYDPTQPVYSNNNRFGGYHEWVNASGNLIANIPYNPLGLLNEENNVSSPERSIGNIQLDYNLPFLPELHVKVNAGYDIAKGKGTDYISDSAASTYTRAGKNNPYETDVQNSLFEFYLNYVKDLKSIKSKIDAIAGYSYNDYLTTNYEYGDHEANGIEYGPGDSTAPYDKPQNVIISFLARAAYSFEDKYYLTGTIRDDGSSQFGPYGQGVTISTIGNGNKWGLFPSVAFKWRIGQENFLKNNKVLSNLDLRAGYGITGQQDGIIDYSYLATYAQSTSTAAYQFGNQFVQGYRPGGYDGGLTWEQTATSNIGLDYGFLNNRINGNIDFYDKKTSRLLENIAEPAGTNFSAFVLSNVGNMENKGIEFSVNTQPIKSKNFNWDANFNLTYNQNTITNLTVIPDDPTFPGIGTGTISGTGAQGYAQIYAVGYSKSTFNLYQQVYDQNGKPIEGVFNDVNRDGEISGADAVKGKRSDPNLFLGFSTDFSYKKISLGFVLRASFNNYVYNQFYATNGTLNDMLGGTVIGNLSTNYLQTSFTGKSTNQFLSDYYLQNASFLKMDNLNVGYDFGKIFKHNNGTLRAVFSVQNVFVITKYTGIDPEVSNGIDNSSSSYPRPRIFSLGLNLHI